MVQNFLDNHDIEEKASDLFLDSARNQYFFDSNKRTAQIMMNGFLILNEYAPRSIQKEYLASYNEKMARFYHSNDKKEMREFLEKSQALSAIVFRAKGKEAIQDKLFAIAHNEIMAEVQKIMPLNEQGQRNLENTTDQQLGAAMKYGKKLNIDELRENIKN